MYIEKYSQDILEFFFFINFRKVLSSDSNRFDG